MKIKLFILLSLLSTGLYAKGIQQAPVTSDRGITPNWSSAKKTQVGTSYSKNSLVWFTNADGILTETYFPTIDSAQIKDAQLIATDGKNYFIDEKNGMKHETRVLDASLVENVNITDKFISSSIYYTMQSKDILINEINLFVKEDGLKFYLLVNPALNNTGYHDNGESSSESLYFWQDNTSLYVRSNVGFGESSIGYVGINDGHLDLRTHYQLTSKTQRLENGNIAGTARINIPSKAGYYKFYITYSFGSDEVLSVAQLANAKANYKNDWNNYIKSLNQPHFESANQKLLYERSLYTLKVHEDKLNPGAMIASLSKPWGEELYEYPGVFTGGYHLVWPRDHYHVSLALLHSGDLKTPIDALGFLKRIQYQSGVWNFNNERVIPKKGAFPQNVWTNLNEYWGGLQIDQVGYPIHLFYQVMKKMPSHSEQQKLKNKFHSMIFDAAEFIYNYGPWSAQERWEENFGISPSSFSVATSALILASEILEDSKYAHRAGQWLNNPGDNIHNWTFTTNGIYGDGNYYLRVAGCASFTATWDPNDYSWCTIANSGQRIPMNKILDQGFLKLALLGLVPANDWKIKTSLQKVNQNIRQTFNDTQGEQFSGWYRYSFDAYGEQKRGRIWPLLSGEHGRYAIERFNDNDLSWEKTTNIVNNILRSYEYFSNNGLMIPEQIFESSGLGTGAATPLAWSHAEFIKLLWSKEKKENIENAFNLRK